MAIESTLELRVAALEQAVANLQLRVAAVPSSENWLEKVSGSISDEAAFLEALEYGRAYRYSDRPPDDIAEQP